MDNRALKFKIQKVLQSPDYTPVSMHELMAKLKIQSKQRTAFFATVNRLSKSGEIEITESGKLVATRDGSAFEATILSITAKGAFARPTSADPKDRSNDVFIFPENLNGAMPSDKVKIVVTRKSADRKIGMVTKIEQHSFVKFTGILHKLGKTAYVEPTEKYKGKILIDYKEARNHKDNELVMAKMLTYTSRKHQASAMILESYGDCESARACCQAILDEHHARKFFPQEVIDEAQHISTQFSVDKDRVDLRDLPIFTIDGATAKDLDDSVSIKKTEKGYTLGVHIADVSNYVKELSKLDNEAFLRGTSIYFGNTVIPMLPKELSNGICSLNPNEDRLTFSAFMDVDNSGNLLNYKIAKSVIRSRVKGVYSEVNEIFNETASEEILEKYKEVLSELKIMKELAEILRKAKDRRGAIDFASDEAELIIDENGVIEDIKKRERGEAERMIEEFMILANEAVATVAIENKIPFVFRIHEEPEFSKLDDLAAAYRAQGIDARSIKAGVTPLQLKAALESAKGTAKEKALSTLTLRCMSKARYDPVCRGHFGLALKNYCHFTSPIRRYPDLSIHRVLSEMLKGTTATWITGHFKTFVEESSVNSSEKEISAMQIEWDCEDAYKAEYMTKNIGKTFKGIVSSVKPFGMYVMLDNTIEGLVKIENMPGWFDFDEKTLTLKNNSTKAAYTIGDSVEIIVQGADIPTGKIDFSLI